MSQDRLLEAALRAMLEGMEAAGLRVVHKEAVVRRDAGDRPDLPAPRLQLRYEGPELCHYELVLPVREGDIRREHGDVLGSRFLAVPLGCTRMLGSQPRSPAWKDPQTERWHINPPFRDGAHACWDAVALKLPLFILWEELVVEIDPLAAPEDA